MHMHILDFFQIDHNGLSKLATKKIIENMQFRCFV